MQYRELDDAPESEAIYLVQKKHRSKKTLVQRPLLSPLSSALDDDFDAITQTRTIAMGGPDAEWGVQGRLKTPQVPSTLPPLDDDFDTITNTATKGPETVAESEWGTRHRLRTRTRTGSKDTGNYGGAGGYRNRDFSQSGFDDYGDYRKYMNRKMDQWSMVRVRQDISHGGSNGSSRRVPVASGERRNLVVPEKKLATGTGRGGRNPLPPTKGRVGDVRGPARGQDYQMIDRRVVEDGPERTVTISTWRGEVARCASDDDEMSVYYVKPNDYAQGVRKAYEMVREVDGLAHRARRRASHEDSRQKLGNKSNLGGSGEKGKTQVFSTSHLSLEKPNHRFSSDPAAAPSRTVRLPTKDGVPFSQSSEAKSHSLETNHTDSLHHIPPTRERRRTDPRRTPPRTSTPRKGRYSPPMFQRTSSGSSISSIKDGPSSFEAILLSCRPSLLHIEPILARLGIRTEEHLRAVSRLSEETRDREVKEEALKNGVTVVEWAMLLDKLQTL